MLSVSVTSRRSIAFENHSQLTRVVMRTYFTKDTRNHKGNDLPREVLECPSPQ
jgi:hypothetical protein